jgi:hypothetical protein
MEILILAGLILLNGLFSMAEIALVSARKSRLEIQANKGDKEAAEALKLANKPETFLSTVQMGITVISILTGIYSGEKITDDFAAYLSKWPSIEPYSYGIATAIVVIIVTYFTIVFGELVPAGGQPLDLGKVHAGPPASGAAHPGAAAIGGGNSRPRKSRPSAMAAPVANTAPRETVREWNGWRPCRGRRPVVPFHVEETRLLIEARTHDDADPHAPGRMGRRSCGIQTEGLVRC